MRYVLVLCLGLCGISCSTVRGNIDLTRNDKGEIMTVKYDAKGTVDFKIKKDEVEVKTKKIPKPSMLDKVADLATIGLTNRVVNNEEDKD